MKPRKIPVTRRKMRRRRKIIDEMNRRVGLPKPANDKEYNKLWKIWRATGGGMWV
jgi:hypothetical protein